jgi:hypothetical protein
MAKCGISQSVLYFPRSKTDAWCKSEAHIFMNAKVGHKPNCKARCGLRINGFNAVPDSVLTGSNHSIGKLRVGFWIKPEISGIAGYGKAKMYLSFIKLGQINTVTVILLRKDPQRKEGKNKYETAFLQWYKNVFL